MSCVILVYLELSFPLACCGLRIDRYCGFRRFEEEIAKCGNKDGEMKWRFSQAMGVKLAMWYVCGEVVLSRDKGFRLPSTLALPPSCATLTFLLAKYICGLLG